MKCLVFLLLVLHVIFSPVFAMFAIIQGHKVIFG